MPPDPLAASQARMNASTKGQWDCYASHRAAIERHLIPQAAGQSITVLGAGNCNDLDLPWLARVYARVTLVDIDAAALEAAVTKQRVTDLKNIHRLAPVDLTSVAQLTAPWKGRIVSQPDIQTALESIRNTEPIPSLEPADFVLSPCVLSQLMVALRDIVGKHHPSWPTLKAAILHRHLQTLSRLTRSGGRGALIIDLSSSSVIPNLDRATPADLPALMRRATVDGKCFKGLEPASLTAAIRADPTLQLSSLEVTQPWLWHLGFGKAFLCYALTFKRRNEAG